MHPSRRPAVVRGFSASSLATFVALAAHVSAGGAMPGPLGILVPWMLSTAACILLAGRKLSTIRLTLSVALSQFLFHVLFVLGVVSPGAASTSAHVHGTVQLPSGGTVEAALLSAPDTAMWIGHIVAALVTILALHRGEVWGHRLRELAVRAVVWLRRRLHVPFVPSRSTPVSSCRGVFVTVPPKDAPLLARVRGRAPPLSVAI